jgi:hypothetical protein
MSATSLLPFSSQLQIFNALSDRASTFKHVYAIVAHSGIVLAQLSDG